MRISVLPNDPGYHHLAAGGWFEALIDGAHCFGVITADEEMGEVLAYDPCFALNAAGDGVYTIKLFGKVVIRPRELGSERVNIAAAELLANIRKERGEGPKGCDCPCHSSPTVLHAFPCCDETYAQRADK